MDPIFKKSHSPHSLFSDHLFLWLFYCGFLTGVVYIFCLSIVSSYSLLYLLHSSFITPAFSTLQKQLKVNNNLHILKPAANSQYLLH